MGVWRGDAQPPQQSYFGRKNENLCNKSGFPERLSLRIAASLVE